MTFHCLHEIGDGYFSIIFHESHDIPENDENAVIVQRQVIERLLGTEYVADYAPSLKNSFVWFIADYYGLSINF